MSYTKLQQMNLKFIHDSREKYVKIGKNLVKLQQLLDSQFTFWATIGRAVSKKETAKPM